MEKIVKTDEEWRQQLTPEQYRRHPQEGYRATLYGRVLPHPRTGVVWLRLLRLAAV